jgi:hypothetical protein
MAKDKARNAAKKRQERALKAARRKKAAKGPSKPQVAAPFRLPEGAFPEDVRMFWAAHGINFLNSDWDNVVWNPLYPEIYTDPEKLTLDLLSSRLDSMSGQDVEKMSGPHRAILGYAFQDEIAHYAFMKEAERRVSEQGLNPEEARNPHQGVVWQMFHDEILVKALQRAEGA